MEPRFLLLRAVQKNGEIGKANLSSFKKTAIFRILVEKGETNISRTVDFQGENGVLIAVASVERAGFAALGHQGGTCPANGNRLRARGDLERRLGTCGRPVYLLDNVRGTWEAQRRERDPSGRSSCEKGGVENA